MEARLILSISSNGQFRISLLGKGKARQRMLKAYERVIENHIPMMKYKLRTLLEGNYEDSNFNIN